MTCTNCHADVASSAMASHQKGGRCRVDTAIRENTEAGRRPVGLTYRTCLNEAGIPYVVAPVRYSRGFRGHPARITYAAWTCASAADVIGLRTAGIMTFAGPIRVSLKAMKEGLRLIAGRNHEMPAL